MELVQITFKFLIKLHYYLFSCIFSVFLFNFFLLDPGGKMNADPCGPGVVHMHIRVGQFFRI